MSSLLVRRSLPIAIAAAIAATVSHPASAQQATPPPQTAQSATQDQVQYLDTIVVVGQRASIRRAIRAEQTADNLVNVVASEDIGEFADQNVAESLQRVPGITLNRSEGEGRSVSVRGLPSSFTEVTVNGVRMGTSDADDTSVSLDSVSNDQLEEITVHKAVMPNQDADTIGGSIDLKTISAFTREDDQITLRAEGYFSEEASDWGEQVSGSITRRMMDGRLGVAATVSHSRRPIEGFELEADGGLDAVSTEGEDGPEYLRPNEVTIVRETSERTRRNASLNLEFRPDDDNQYFLRGTFSHLNDEDLAYQDIWVIEESEDEAILEARPRGGTFDEVELEKRLFFQDMTDRIFTVAAGGIHFMGPWKVDYQADYSRSNFDNPEALRGRFAVKDVLAELDVTEDSVRVSGQPGDDGDGGDPTDAGDYEFNQLLFVNERRQDAIATARIDFTRSFDSLLDVPGEISFGFKHRNRQKSNDREEFTGNPESNDYEGELEDLPLFTQNTPFGYNAFFPQRRETFAFFRDARDYLIANNPGYQRIDLSNSGDYEVEDAVTAAYVQTKLELSPALRLIAGLRVERTESSSQGYYTEFDSRGRGPDRVPGNGEVIHLGEVTQTYTDWFPGMHMLWSPTQRVIVRASASRGIQRPDFTDRINRLRVQFDSNDPDDRDLYAGNPYLKPLSANQFDASVAWYPNPETALQAAIFYKDIDNYFFDFSGDGDQLGLTPIQLPAGVNPDFENIETVLNGERARVGGVELSYVQAFTTLPGWLSGLFTQANVTWVHSEATTEVRDGEIFSLPFQRDLVGNLSLGWENDRFSIRGSANYLGESLVVIAGDAEEDVYTKPMTTVDLNLRYKLSNALELHLDAVNVTNEGEIEYYQGDNHGRLVYLNSNFGRTYRVGLRMRF